jgi:hypothetical protein
MLPGGVYQRGSGQIKQRSGLMCFVSVGLVVGLIVLVAVVCLLVLYFRKPTNRSHLRSRVSLLLGVRHNGQFHYSRVSRPWQSFQLVTKVCFCSTRPVGLPPGLYLNVSKLWCNCVGSTRFEVLTAVNIHPFTCFVFAASLPPIQLEINIHRSYLRKFEAPPICFCYRVTTLTHV